MENGHTHSLNPFDHDDSMEDSVEFRLLMAYAKRRRPTRGGESPAQNSLTVQNRGSHPKEPSSLETPTEGTKEAERTTAKTKKKKKGWKRLFKCIRPQTEEKDPAPNQTEDPIFRSGCVVERFFQLSPIEAAGDRAELQDEEKEEEEEEEEKLKVVAGRLAAIAKEIPFTPPEIESDSPGENLKTVEADEVEKVIGLLLREAGDRLNNEELKNADLSAALFGKYSFFETLLTTLLEKMGLLTPKTVTLGPQASPKTQIAVTCEVTSRLSAVDTLPMNRMLDHGARYLQKYYSSWAQQQGGYEEAFHSDDDDDDDVQ